MIAAASLLGNWKDAADQYIELINAYPGDAALAQEAALAAGAHGQREKLLDFYRKTIDASPRDARWSILLARLETALEMIPRRLTLTPRPLIRGPSRRICMSRKPIWRSGSIALTMRSPITSSSTN